MEGWRSGQEIYDVHEIPTENEIYSYSFIVSNISISINITSIILGYWNCFFSFNYMLWWECSSFQSHPEGSSAEASNHFIRPQPQLPTNCHHTIESSVKWKRGTAQCIVILQPYLFTSSNILHVGSSRHIFSFVFDFPYFPRMNYKINNNNINRKK